MEAPVVWTSTDGIREDCKVCGRGTSLVWEGFRVGGPAGPVHRVDTRCKLCLPQWLKDRLQHKSPVEWKPPVVLIGDAGSGAPLLAFVLARAGVWFGVPGRGNVAYFTDRSLDKEVQQVLRGFRFPYPWGPVSQAMKAGRDRVVGRLAGPYRWGVTHPDLIWSIGAWKAIPRSRIIVVERRDTSAWKKILRERVSRYRADREVEQRRKIAETFEGQRRLRRVMIEDVLDRPKRWLGRLGRFVGIPELSDIPLP